MINSNLLFRQGSDIATISEPKSIFARATVTEQFPREVAIYDLNSLLQLLTFSEGQDIDFGEKSMTIKNDSGTFEYFYCEPNLITAAPTKRIEVEEFFSFSLTSKDVQMIIKIAGLLSAPTISLKARNGKVVLKVGDRKNDSANSFNKVIGDTDKEFEVLISSENFKLMPDAYDVKLSVKKFCEFKSKSVTYMIAMEPDSTVA